MVFLGVGAFLATAAFFAAAFFTGVFLAGAFFTGVLFAGVLFVGAFFTGVAFLGPSTATFAALVATAFFATAAVLVVADFLTPTVLDALVAGFAAGFAGAFTFGLGIEGGVYFDGALRTRRSRSSSTGLVLGRGARVVERERFASGDEDAALTAAAFFAAAFFAAASFLAAASFFSAACFLASSWALKKALAAIFPGLGGLRRAALSSDDDVWGRVRVLRPYIRGRGDPDDGTGSASFRGEVAFLGACFLGEGVLLARADAIGCSVGRVRTRSYLKYIKFKGPRTGGGSNRRRNTDLWRSARVFARGRPIVLALRRSRLRISPTVLKI